LDGQRIIIFGGTVGRTDPIDFVPSSEALYVLNLNRMKWSIPNVSGKTPNSRQRHKANVIGRYSI